MSHTVRFLLDAVLVVTGALLLSSLTGQRRDTPATAATAGDARLAARITPSTAIGTAVAASVAVQTPTDEGLAPSPNPVPAEVCEHATDDVDATDDDAFRAATLCLLNNERRTYGLRALRSSVPLLRIARSHSRDMVARSYFDHTTRGGGDFASRILRSGFVAKGALYNIGENIGWGSSDEGTARALVRAWMDSPPHRANILEHAFRSIGIGLDRGAPNTGDFPGAVTMTTDFG